MPQRFTTTSTGRYMDGEANRADVVPSHPKTILYVEEVENNFANGLLNSQEVSLIFLRFQNCMNFSSEHLKRTQKIPTFVWNKKMPFEEECIAFKKFLGELGRNIDYFYNDSEFNQVLAQKIARALKIPGSLSEEQADIVRDKVLMKKFIRAQGLDCVDYAAVHDVKQVTDFAQQHGYPIILKWRTGVSSIEVYKVESKSDLELLNLDFATSRYMVEEFCEDKIWCIDALVVNGKVQDNFYTWLPYTNLSFAECKKRFAQISTGCHPDNWIFDPHELTQRILTGLGELSGYLHLEAFISKKGKPVICEFAWRTPGDQMISNISHVYETNIAQRIIDSFWGIGHQMLPICEKCVADVFLPLENGRILSITDYKTLSKRVPLLAGKVLYSRGDIVKSQHKYTDSAGWVQIEGKSLEEIMEKIDAIYDAFELVVEV